MTPWESLLRRHGVLTNKHPIELFGKPVCARISSVSNPWAAALLTGVSLSVLALSIGGLTWALWHTNGSKLHVGFGGAVSTVTMLLGVKFLKSHFHVGLDDLHALAETEDQHRWIDRLDEHCNLLISGDIPARIAQKGQSANGQPLHANCLKRFKGNDARRFVIASYSGNYDEQHRSLRNLTIDVDNFVDEPDAATCLENTSTLEVGEAENSWTANTIEKNAATQTVDSSSTPNPEQEGEHWLRPPLKPTLRTMLREFFEQEKKPKTEQKVLRLIFLSAGKFVKEDPGIKPTKLAAKVVADIQKSLGPDCPSVGVVARWVGWDNRALYGSFRGFVQARQNRPPSG